MADTVVVKYGGIDRRGMIRTGTLGPPSSLSRWVEELFDKGWRRLAVTIDGRLVAEITRDPARPRRRTWYAEEGAGRAGLRQSDPTPSGLDCPHDAADVGPDPGA